MEVELPAERLQRSIEESIRHLGRRTRVPGFRPGKIPRPVLERALGVRRDDPAATNPIYDDAKEHLFEASVIEALKEADLDILSIPQPEWVSFDEGRGATYRVVLPVRPDVKLGAYTDYPFAITLETVDDPKVDAVVDQLRDQHASLVPVEGRGAEEGDYAVISFEATREGQPFEGGSAERFPLIIGKERIIPGFEAQLHGLGERDEKNFSLTFPDDYPDPDLAGKPADFHVTVRELRAKLLPAADDEFAQTVGDYRDLAALRADVRTRLEANARDHARHDFADRIIEFAVTNASVELPDLLVEREVEVMLDELKLRLAEQRIGWEEYLKVTGRDEAALLAEQREPAQKRVKTLLVLSAIADREEVDVDDAEIDAEIDKARTRYADNPKLVAYFESSRGRGYLRSTLRRSKIVETLVDRWLQAHPEAGEFPHLEEEPTRAVESAVPADAQPSGEPSTITESAAVGAGAGEVTQESHASPERVA